MNRFGARPGGRLIAGWICFWEGTGGRAPGAYPAEPELSNPSDTPLALIGVGKRLGRKEVLFGVSAAFRTGELTVVRGGRGAGKTTLARLLVGQIHPDLGEVRRDGLAPPLIGSTAGFPKGAPPLRGLDLRAAAFGLDTRAYARAVAALMDRPEALLEPFERLRGRDRTLLTCAAGWLLPARLYVADGRLLPADAEARERLRPLWLAARERAAVVWIADAKTTVGAYKPSRLVRLDQGRLLPDADGMK